jgi:hypothetical protein
VPLTVDGLIYASSMVMLGSARRKTPVPALARWLLGLGIAATLAANVAHGLGHGPVGAAVAAWPAVALAGSYELFMMVIRSSQAAPDSASGSEGIPDPLQEQAAEVFSDELAADRVPSVRAIRAQLHVCQPRAQRLRDYLAAGLQGELKSRCMSMTSGRFRNLPVGDDSGVISMAGITGVCRALLDIGFPGRCGVGRGSRGTGGAGRRGPASLSGVRRLGP